MRRHGFLLPLAAALAALVASCLPVAHAQSYVRGTTRSPMFRDGQQQPPPRSEGGAPPAAATSNDGGGGGDGEPAARPTAPTLTLGADQAGPRLGPARVVLPADYTASQQWPLVVVLHGYGSTADAHDFYLGVSARASELGFIAVLPNGTWDATAGSHFWNGRACCDHNDLNPDDRAYLVGLVAEAQAKYSVDPARVFAYGHSNGGLMAQVLACHEPETFSGIVGLSPHWVPSACWESKATKPLKVLLVSGTKDKYLPECLIEDNAQRWAAHLQCEYGAARTERRDYDCEYNAPADYDAAYAAFHKDANCALWGKETRVKEWAAGCKSGGKLALWVMEGATHSPSLSSTFVRDALNFLLKDGDAAAAAGGNGGGGGGGGGGLGGIAGGIGWFPRSLAVPLPKGEQEERAQAEAEVPPAETSV